MKYTNLHINPVFGEEERSWYTGGHSILGPGKSLNPGFAVFIIETATMYYQELKSVMKSSGDNGNVFYTHRQSLIVLPDE